MLRLPLHSHADQALIEQTTTEGVPQMQDCDRVKHSGQLRALARWTASWASPATQSGTPIVGEVHSLPLCTADAGSISIANSAPTPRPIWRYQSRHQVCLRKSEAARAGVGGSLATRRAMGHAGYLAQLEADGPTVADWTAELRSEIESKQRLHRSRLVSVRVCS